MKKIAIEEHFSTEELRSVTYSKKDYFRRGEEDYQKMKEALRSSAVNPDVGKRMLDVGEGRLNDMEQSGIQMQVLCVSPGLEELEVSEGTLIAKKTNDALSGIIQKYPERFSGFAALAPQEPTAAALELERSVKELGLKGGKINAHVNGEYLDDPKYWCIFEKAEKLDVPIFIHPNLPSRGMLQPYMEYPVLAGSIWGYGADTGLHAMRLICSGVFDKYPGLKIILGHMGEALPFWLWRIDNRWSKENVSNRLDKKLIKKPSQYVQDNIFVSTSGMFSQPALLCAYLTLGADKILFAVDYPHESNMEAVEFMDKAPICDTDKEKIYHLNAESLLAL